MSNHLSSNLEDVAGQIVDAAFQVHSTLGPGLLESVYESCMAIELVQRGLKIDRQLKLPVTYKGHVFQSALRIDLFVADAIPVELKAIEKLLPVHQAQIMSYMKMLDIRLGFLINFEVARIKDGIRRFVR